MPTFGLQNWHHAGPPMYRGASVVCIHMGTLRQNGAFHCVIHTVKVDIPRPHPPSPLLGGGTPPHPPLLEFCKHRKGVCCCFWLASCFADFLFLAGGAWLLSLFCLCSGLCCFASAALLACCLFCPISFLSRFKQKGGHTTRD